MDLESEEVEILSIMTEKYRKNFNFLLRLYELGKEFDIRVDDLN